MDVPQFGGGVVGVVRSTLDRDGEGIRAAGEQGDHLVRIDVKIAERLELLLRNESS
ncbi:hypothetical protein OG612_43575 (plasmid) [Streptomyces sp. NBC_01527]|uniref:hypothetical protein n=1 Tax=unclassified Streptomyces TaxID=2593676 RepID=UPI002E12A7A8|nr:hypothetical protein OG763_44645 [Streptomyces sp. NBC_01230]